MVSVAKYALMWQKVMPSITQLIRKSMLLIIVLTAMTDALYICSLVIGAKCNMHVRLSMAFVFHGTITKIIIGSRFG